MAKYIYVKSGTDKYEFPEVIADSLGELAKELGRPPGSVASMVSREQSGFFKVPLEEET